MLYQQAIESGSRVLADIHPSPELGLLALGVIAVIAVGGLAVYLIRRSRRTPVQQLKNDLDHRDLRLSPEERFRANADLAGYDHKKN